tara:strand:- start:8345 stop:8797 length:453 start_codon:yes stop_codon:yes gene_type:complete
MGLVPTIKTQIKPLDPKKLTEKEHQQIKDRTPLGLSRAALLGINIIQDRLDRGMGYRGNLEPYSPAYLLLKKKRKPENAGVVNLTWSGGMRGSMSSKYNDRFATIYFTRGAEAKKAAMLNEKRPFFGFNNGDEAKLTEEFREYVFRGFGR